LSAPEGNFDAPWQAHAFALTHALVDAGIVDWAAWTETLSRRLHAEGVAEDGSDYYQHWVAALQEILETRGVADMDQIERLTTEWEAAARATPHGTPITLEAQVGEERP